MTGITPWIFPLLLSCAVVVSAFFALRSTRQTPTRYRPSASADPAWCAEVDAQLADIESRLVGLSSTLRKLHGRESARSARAAPPTVPASDKDELRRQYGVTPARRDVG